MLQMLSASIVLQASDFQFDYMCEFLSVTSLTSYYWLASLKLWHQESTQWIQAWNYGGAEYSILLHEWWYFSVFCLGCLSIAVQVSADGEDEGLYNFVFLCFLANSRLFDNNLRVLISLAISGYIISLKWRYSSSVLILFPSVDYQLNTS